MTTATLDPPSFEAAPPENEFDTPVAPITTAPHPKILRVARVAAFNGWFTGIAAALSVPFAFFSVIGLIVCIGLAVIAFNEFRGRRRLLEQNPNATSLLGWNQVGFLALLVVYCGWMIAQVLTSPNPLAGELAANPDLAAVLGSADQFDLLYQQIAVGFYGLVILLSVIFQGGTSIYYFTRRKYLPA
jgi:hypothetical protein